MQEHLEQSERIHYNPLSSSHSHWGTAFQLGGTSIIVAGTTLVIYNWLMPLHMPLVADVLIVGGIACLTGLLCTLNLQYSLYLLELFLAHLAHDRLSSHENRDEQSRAAAGLWPLSPLFLQVRAVTQRLERYAAHERLTSDFREKTLQQAREAAAQTERDRIARELHDSIKQQIFSISVSAAAARVHGQASQSDEAREAIEDIQRSAKEAQVEMQALLQQLRPAPLENTGLLEALRIQAQALGFRTGAQIHLELGEMPAADRLLPGTQEAVFRLVQEAFANIARHARAQNIWLNLLCLEQSLQIEVRDDGQGFDPATVHRGMGLQNLQERARELHGQAEITSQPGQGASVRINLPLLEALKSPQDEEQRIYDLARAVALARRGYQLGDVMSLLSIALIPMAVTLNLHWSIVPLALLVNLYGFASGIYYRLQAVLKAGQESKLLLELRRQQAHTFVSFLRSLGFACWYGFYSLGLLQFFWGWWIMFGLFSVLLMVALIERRGNYQVTERYYHSLSQQELAWELARRRQGITRSLTVLVLICAFGLSSGYHLLIPPLDTPEKQSAYGVALLLLIMLLSLAVDFAQVRRWQHMPVTTNIEPQESNKERV